MVSQNTLYFKGAIVVKNVIIIGTGGHAKVVTDIVLSARDHLVGFLTNDNSVEEMMGWPVLGKDTDYGQFMDCCFVIAIGDPRIRERLSKTMTGVQWYTAIHPSASISVIQTSIGAGSVIMANAVVNPCTQIGNHCIINSNATVEHENIIEDYVHISVGAKLAGAVKVGRRTWIGIGASVSERVVICGDSMIGAGAVVIKNIEVPGTYVGIPAHKIK